VTTRAVEIILRIRSAAGDLTDATVRVWDAIDERQALLSMEKVATDPTGGEHGYDSRAAPSMGALFVAAGPAFQRGVTVPAFENVHVYEMLVRILGVPAAPNDGNPAIAATLLR